MWREVKSPALPAMRSSLSVLPSSSWSSSQRLHGNTYSLPTSSLPCSRIVTLSKNHPAPWPTPSCPISSRCNVPNDVVLRKNTSTCKRSITIKTKLWYERTISTTQDKHCLFLLQSLYKTGTWRMILMTTLCLCP